MCTAKTMKYVCVSVLLFLISNFFYSYVSKNYPFFVYISKAFLKNNIIQSVDDVYHPDKVYPIPDNIGQVRKAGVNFATGNVNLSVPLANISSRNLDYVITAFYNSRSATMEHVYNVLGGNGWKLLDYPKIVQDRTNFYFLDGQQSYLIDNVVVNPFIGGPYSQWKIEATFIDANTLSWKVKSDKGIIYHLATTSDDNGYTCWHLTQIENPNLKEVLDFRYEQGKIYSIINNLDTRVEFLYNNNYLSSIDVYKSTLPDGTGGVLDSTIKLDYDGQSLLTQVSKSVALKTKKDLALPVTLFDFNYSNLFLQNYTDANGGKTSYYYYTGNSVTATPVTGYSFDNGYSLNRDDNNINYPEHDETYTGIGYLFDNVMNGVDGIYTIYNQVEVYPGFYAGVSGGVSNEVPYGKKVYYFFNGASRDNLHSFPSGYTEIDVTDINLSGYGYCIDTYDAANNQIAKDTFYWDMAYIYQNQGAFLRLTEETKVFEGIEQTIAYSYSSNYKLPSEIAAVRKNLSIDGTLADQELKKQITYAFEKYGALSDLNLLDVPYQVTTLTKTPEQDDWKVINSKILQWGSFSDGNKNIWAPSKMFVLSKELSSEDVLADPDDNAAAWTQQVAFNQIDMVSGKVLSMTNSEGLTTSFTYDYLSRSPVAAFMNADITNSEAGYYGFEVYESNRRQLLEISGDGEFIHINAHTGSRCYDGLQFTISPTYFNLAADSSSYVISAYVYLNSENSKCSLGFKDSSGWVTVKDITNNQTVPQWQYVQVSVPVTSLTAEAKPTFEGTDCAIDDFRFSPLDSLFSAIVYMDQAYFDEDFILLPIDAQGEYKANKVIVVPDDFNLETGKSLALEAGQLIHFGKNTSIDKGASLSVAMHGLLEDNLTLPAAYMGVNGETRRIVYDEYKKISAVLAPGEEVQAVVTSYNSPQGNYFFEDQEGFDSEYPNMVLATVAKEGGIWEGFQFDDISNFVNFSNMAVNQDLLQTTEDLSAGEEAAAEFAGSIASEDYTVSVSVFPNDISEGEEIGIAIGDLYYVLRDSQFILYNKSNSTVYATEQILNLPKVINLTFSVMDKSFVCAFANGRFLFKYTLADVLTPVIKLISSNPGASFDNFIVTESPAIAKTTYDAAWRQTQMQLAVSPNNIYISESLMGSDLDISVAQTRGTIIPVNDTDTEWLSYSSDFVGEFDYSNMTITGGSISEQWQGLCQDGSCFAFTDTQVIENNPLMRIEADGSGGVFTATDHDTNFDYAGDEGLYLTETVGPDNVEKNLFSWKGAFYGVLPYLITTKSHDELLVKGTVDADLILQQQFVYDEALRLQTRYEPNYFSPTREGSSDFKVNFKYDFIGNKTFKHDVDTGITQYGYDMGNRLRLVLDANGKNSDQPYFIYNKYDKLGRITEEGIYNDNTINAVVDISTQSTAMAVADLTVSGVGQSNVTLKAGQSIAFNKGFGLTKGKSLHAILMDDSIGEIFSEQLKDLTWPSENIKWRKSYAYDQDEDGNTQNSIGLLKQIETQDSSVFAEGESLGTVTETFDYDLHGRVVSLATTFSGLDSLINYTYNLLGQVTAITQTTEGLAEYDITYTYDRLGRFQSIGKSDDLDFYASYEYDNGQVREYLNNGDIQIIYTFNGARWISDIQVKVNDTPVFGETLYYGMRADESAGYYNGRISSAHYSINMDSGSYGYTDEYQYDILGRLTQVDRTSPQAILSFGYGYDLNGNIMTFTSDINPENQNDSYYPGTNQIQTVNKITYNYDFNGNLKTTTDDSLIQFSYDPLTNLVNKVDTSEGESSFHYDAHGRRILKISPQNKIAYIRGVGDYPLRELTNDANNNLIATNYISGPMGIIAIEQNGESLFLLKDHLGSTRMVLNQNNQPLSYYTYSPFGLSLGTNDDETSEIRYLYTGQEYDAELCLYNYKARMYNPADKRFISPDPKNDYYSSYAYCHNNPVSFVDPDGEAVVAVIGLFVTALAEIAPKVAIAAAIIGTFHFIETAGSYEGNHEWGGFIEGAWQGVNVFGATFLLGMAETTVFLRSMAGYSTCRHSAESVGCMITGSVISAGGLMALGIVDHFLQIGFRSWFHDDTSEEENGVSYYPLFGEIIGDSIAFLINVAGAQLTKCKCFSPAISNMVVFTSLLAGGVAGTTIGMLFEGVDRFVDYTSHFNTWGNMMFDNGVIAGFITIMNYYYKIHMHPQIGDIPA